MISSPNDYTRERALELAHFSQVYICVMASRRYRFDRPDSSCAAQSIHFSEGKKKNNPNMKNSRKNNDHILLSKSRIRE
jgi:hypothetical protein